MRHGICSLRVRERSKVDEWRRTGYPFCFRGMGYGIALALNVRYIRNRELET